MYIEFVIADNFLLTYLSGAAAARFCHKRVGVLRTTLAAAVGTVAAVAYPFIHIGFWYLAAIKIVLWAALSAIMYAKTQRCAVSALMFLGCTFCFGGACYAVWIALCSAFPAFAAAVGDCPMFLTLGAGAIVYAGMRYAIKKVRLLRAREPYEYLTEVEVFGKKLTFCAFLDTGNAVFDNVTGLPVIITDANRLSRKLDGASAAEFIKNVDRFRVMTVKTAAGETTVRLIKTNSVTVYSDKRGHKIDAMVGIVGGQAFSSKHEMLIGPSAFSEGV